MGKKKQEKKVVENVDIDALVDEGKNIDTVKVSEVIADKEEDNKEAETVEIEGMNSLVQKVKDTQAEYIMKDTLADTAEDNDEDDEEEIESEVNEDSDKSDEPYDDGEEDCNIDDVIAECTGDTEAEEAPKKGKTKEPWYVARARRIGDYYNW